MKKVTFTVMLAVFLLVSLSPSVGAAKRRSSTPRLLGEWEVKISGAFTLGVDHPAAFTQEIQMNVTLQEGFRFGGTMAFPKGRETFAGIVDFDNNSLLFVGSGFTAQGRMVAATKIEVVFQEQGADGSFVGRGLMVKKPPKK